MDRKKIKQFNKCIKEGDFKKAAQLISSILTYDQYASFCQKAFAYCREKNYSEMKNSHKYSIQNIYIFQLTEYAANEVKQREQEMLSKEAIAKHAEEAAGFARTVFEDAETSFELMSEKIAKFYNEEIFDLALLEMKK